MKAIITIILATFFSSAGLSQATILADGPATPGQNQIYRATFYGSLNPYTHIVWSVSGGTIVSFDNYPELPLWCIVEWDSDPSTPGIIYIHEDVDNQSGEFQALNAIPPPPTINLSNQALSYEVTPALLQINFVTYPDGGITYQWQKWNASTTSWNSLTGETGYSYQPPQALETALYRCYVVTSIDAYYLESVVSIPALINPTIFLTNPSAPVNYNGLPAITSFDATGGSCYSNQYIYTWEYSIEGGPWFAVGSSSTFPGAAPAIIGVTKIRRKVQCGQQVIKSNELTIIPNYTPVDFENLNYVRTITVTKKGIRTWNEADMQEIGDKFQSTTYLDGQGRAIQTVEKGVSAAGGGTWKDLVKHIEYDAAGRTVKDFLPYATSDNAGKFKTNAATSQPGYIQSFFSEPGGAPTFGNVEYDESPLDQVVKTMAPGAAWGGNGIGITNIRDFNTANEKVHIWNLDYSLSALPESNASAVYATGTLLREIGTDEKQNRTITYSDLFGNIILKKVQETENPGIEHEGWVCTYYVYDDLNRLRYIISPKAVAFLDNHNWALSQAIADELCYKYGFDNKGRASVQKQPGVGESWTVYDNKDRVVFTQDALQRQSNQWMTALYDALNRPLITGLIGYSGDRAVLQNAVDIKMSAYPSGNTGLPVDLELRDANTGGPHPALRSISMSDGFSTTDAEDFTAEIISGNGGRDGETIIMEGVPVNKNPLPDGSSLTTLSVTYYDDYEFGGAKSYNNTYTLAYNTSTPGIETTTMSKRVKDKITGGKIRILDEDGINSNDKFLFSTVYYDDEGRTIQMLADNNQGGLDYQVSQYLFSNLTVSSFNSHSTGTGTPFTITAKYEFDKIGRQVKLYKNFNNTFYKALAEYSYDELGQLKTKKLAPGYNGSQLELLTYDYNIQGHLTGINKAYALSNNNYTQWDHYFGLYLGYENQDAKFNAAQFNGALTGAAWRSQGDNVVRKFDFTYDRIGRFTSAIFKQKKLPADASWSSTEIDFSTYVTYEDGNGNLKSMKHMGVVPGINNGVVIDDLQYSYLPTGVTGLDGNMLKQVDDQGALSSANNGLLGDFKDGNNTQDYVYDVNGNLVKDLNKHIKYGSNNGVTYNYLNKPSRIIIEGKSIIDFIYSASGERLGKKVTYADNSIRTTTYNGVYVYEKFVPAGGGGSGEQLQYVSYEDGRLKIITPHAKVNDNDYEVNAGAAGVTWPGGKQGVFEYFIKDQLGSTRMVLTEEVQKEYYKASMEQSAAALEERLFGQVDVNGAPTPANELAKTRLANSPPSSTVWPGNNTDVAKLTASAAGRVMGPNLILKVMAGDVINSNVNYYYLANNSSGTSNLLNDLAGSFVSALSGGVANGLGKNQSTLVGQSLSGDLPLSSFLQQHNNAGSVPKAYLNVVFLDEQFRFIEADPVSTDVGSSFQKVSSNNDPNASLFLQQKAPKNGWAFVFISNESDEPVYFDNLLVSQEHGRIAEENHYYPYGLKIAGISSRAVNKMANLRNYQGDFAEHEPETGWDEFDLRMYDPQIGRWAAADPYDVYASPYIGMGNDPTNRIDPDGGFDWFQNNVTKRMSWFEGKGESDYIEGYTWYAVEGPIFDPNHGEGWGDAFGKFQPRATSNVIIKKGLYNPDPDLGNQTALEEVVARSNTANDEVYRVIKSATTAAGWAGLSWDTWYKSQYKGDWLYRNSQKAVTSIFDTKYGAGRTPENLGNIKNYSRNAQGAIRGTRVVKIIKAVSGTIVVLSTLADYGQAYYAYVNNDPNADRYLAKAGINTGVTILSATLPGVGWVIGGVYFLGDALLPGGWEGALNKLGEIQEYNSKALGYHWNPHRD